MTPEQIEAKAQDLLKELNEIYFRNEIDSFEISKAEHNTFINFHINKNLTYNLTINKLNKLLSLEIEFFYSDVCPHFYYTIPND